MKKLNTQFSLFITVFLLELRNRIYVLARIKSNKIITFISCFFLLLSANEVFAVIQTDVTYSASPLQVTLKWNSQGTGSQVQIFRRQLGEEGSSTWISQTTVTYPVLTYTDNTISADIAYEYQLIKVGDAATKGYIAAGLNVPMVEDRGIILLVTDNTISTPLSSELHRFEQDLTGDGWSVLRYNSARHGSGTPAALKTWIKSQYDANPTQVKALLLFGHLPVCMSGYAAPDGHELRPHATDLFYADMDGSWTDVQTLSASNIPADGIYDQSFLPGNNKVEIQVGRIDLSGMTAFSSAEIELLRNYLNKDYYWRHGITKAPLKGIAGNNYLSMETSAMYSLFGSTNVVTGTFANSLTNQYIWGIDFGDANRNNYPGYNYKMTFTVNFGSYKQNFESNNNQMRAILCMPDYGLTSAWGSRPNWFFHHMGMGQNIGYSAYRTQNNGNSDYTPACHYWFQGGIWNNLMGDLTLRMHVVEPPKNITATLNAGVQLSWNASADASSGYHVYRSTSEFGPYTRVTSTPVTDTTYTDAGPGSTVFYMVRALKLENAASGSYYNLSQGVFIQNPSIPVVDTLAPAAPTKLAVSNYTPTGFTLSWAASTDNTGVILYEIFKDGVLIGTTDSTSFDVTGLTTNTTYAMTVKAKDAADNVSVSSATLNAVIDTQAPSAPTILVSSYVTQNAFTISWTASTDNVKVSGYNLYVDGVFYASIVKPDYSTPLPTSCRVLEKYIGNYSITVKAIDGMGNISDASTPLNVSTSPVNPNVITLNPSADIDTYSPSDTGTVLYFSQGGTRSFMKYDITSLTGTVSSAILRFYQTSGTSTYTLNIYATSNDTWVEGGTKPTVGTLITSVNPSGASGYVEIDLTSLIQSEMTTGNKIVSISLSDLSAWVMYNSRQNTVNQPQLVLTGSFVADTLVPTVPTELVSSAITTTSFILSWTASTDNIGVTEYDIYENGILIGTTADTSINVSGLTSATTYSMTVKAKDAAGNVSASSTALNVTTKCYTSSNQILTLCAGQHVTVGTNTYTTSGTYTDVLATSAGCDSIVSTNLTVNSAVDIATSTSGATLTANAAGATYQWIDCNNANAPIAGATNQTYTVTANGNYAVIVTQNNCTDTSSCITVNATTTKEIISAKSVSVYPNPSNGQFKIELELNSKAQVIICNTLGETIYKAQAQQGKQEVNISDFAKGIYMLKVFNNEQQQYVRIVKQ